MKYVLFNEEHLEKYTKSLKIDFNHIVEVDFHFNLTINLMDWLNLRRFSSNNHLVKYKIQNRMKWPIGTIVLCFRIINLVR